tara:strand:- start:38 stop:157 length:120 start_codon:yes stop_codon:yes gene_type:complete
MSDFGNLAVFARKIELDFLKFKNINTLGEFDENSFTELS